METDWKQKYEAALEAAKKLRESKYQTMNVKRVVDEIFPELAESEDERIRKAIVDVINNSNDIDIYSHKHMIAWLEKQKAKERLDRMAPIYNDKESFESALEKAWKYYNDSSSRTVDSFEDDYIECVFSKGFREGFLYKEKQKEQKSATIEQVYEKFVKPEVIKEARTNKYIRAQLLWELMHNGIITEVDYNYLTDDSRKPCSKEEYRKAYKDGFEVSEQLKQKEQKPVEWSEEDEKMLNLAISWMEAFLSEHRFLTAMAIDSNITQLRSVISWLKSLSPQTKVEWSTKDKQMLSSIQNDLMIIAKESGGERREKYLQKVQFIEELFSRPQPKIEWREEDEKPFNDVLSGLKYAYEDLINNKSLDSAKDIKEAFDWMQARVKNFRPQPKVEWSKENEHRRTDAIYFLETAKSHYADTSELDSTIAWLKSLRPSWKPSEEQMASLSIAQECVYADADRIALKSLYNDLMKYCKK